MLVAFFFISLGALVYTYFLYPAILFVLAKLIGRKPVFRDDFLPPVSMIIAAHNEEAVIEDKIQNCLRLNYPREKLEVVIASDGSDDSTNPIARRYADRGICLHETARVGKIRAVKQTVARTHHEVLVFSDANTMYEPDSLRTLVGYLSGNRVGAVTGDVRLVNPDPALGKSEGLYYKYERFIQQCESDLGAVIGVDGAMVAVKRAAYVPPSDASASDDFVIGMNVLRNGRRVVYAPDAIAYEDSTSTIRQELRRRARYTSATMQVGLAGEGIPHYWQVGLWWMYLSHKFLRWIAGCFLLALFVASALGLAHPLLAVAFASQCAFYALAGFGFLLQGRRMPVFIRVPFYFTLQNLGSLAGVLMAAFRSRRVAWSSPTRTKVALPGSEL